MRPVRALAALAAVTATALALSAAPALATAGQHFTAAEYPATITGSTHEATPEFVFGSDHVRCETLSLAGTLSGASETLSLLPSDSGCKTLVSNSWFAVSVERHGCQYVLHTSEVLDIASTSGESCKEHPITLKSTLGCEITVGPQAGVHYAKYTNESGGAIGVSLSNGSIAYHANTSPGCPPNGEAATMSFSERLEGSDELGEADALAVK